MVFFNLWKHSKHFFMKKILFIIALPVSLMTTTFAQNKTDLKTESIKVEGVCSSCKKRIENAAYIPGVKLAQWDKMTGLLTVTYKTSKTDVDHISKAVAQKGHHAGEVKADRATYEKLPPCCAYETNHKH